MKDRLELMTQTDVRTQVLLRELQVQRAKKCQDKQGKRGPAPAVMGWHVVGQLQPRDPEKAAGGVCASVSVVLYVRKQNEEKYKRKRGMCWPA